MNTKDLMSPAQAGRGKRARFNPLTNLQPASLSRYLDAFEAGYLREAVGVWEALEQRDDLLRAVISKRKKSVARHGWTVLPKADLMEAEKGSAQEHAEALEYFYHNLECEHAVDTAEKGGFKLLARQMMDAVGKRFAVHEIIWKGEEGAGDRANPGLQAGATSGMNRNFVTAKFRFVPLGFFENTTGRLRFLENESAQEGRELEAGAWLTTVGDGLMIASSTAWMFKHLSLDDWLQCSQRNGTPALRGVSAAARDSAEWNALESAIEGLLEGESIVHSTADDVEVLNLMGGTNIPFPELVERIDRMLAALWRGADLSTISRERGYGASLQEKETCALEEDDAEMLTETLHRYVDEWVIRYVFGEGVRPLAGIKVLVSPRECTTGDLQIDEFLLKHGAPLSVLETMSRYGRALPKAGEKIFTAKDGEGTASPKGASHHENSRTLTNNLQASRPESSQGSGLAEGLDQGAGCGPSVIFRGGSPAKMGSYTEDTEGTEKPGDAALGNEFTLLQEDWVQLSPFGDFAHARGVQRVDGAAVEGMVGQFRSFRGRLGRLFGGVPFYVGHPDLAGANEWVDRKAYGWVMELEGREDGFYGRVKWSEAGMALLRNAHFKFLSPYWEAREIGSEAGRRVFRPSALISVGLTNQPNIPVRPLANEERKGEGEITNDQALMTREFPKVGNDKRDGVELGGPENLGAGGVGNGSAGASPHLATVGRGRTAPRLNQSTVLESCRAGRWSSMHITSCTEGLGNRKSELVRMQNRRDRIQEAVLGKVRLGMSYDEAWESVKREHALWFEQGR